MTDLRTPPIVRLRVLSFPSWYEIRTIPEIAATALPVALHLGEREAILLAETLRADVLLIDEQAGRNIALSRKIPLSGTLGVLERADTTGLIANYPEVLEQLKASGFLTLNRWNGTYWSVMQCDEREAGDNYAASGGFCAMTARESGSWKSDLMP